MCAQRHLNDDAYDDQSLWFFVWIFLTKALICCFCSWPSLVSFSFQVFWPPLLVLHVFLIGQPSNDKTRTLRKKIEQKAESSTFLMNPLRYLQSNDQSILAREKYVHVRDELIISNQKQSEDEKRSILENDIQKNVPNVNWAANFFGALTASQIILPFRGVLRRRH